MRNCAVRCKFADVSDESIASDFMVEDKPWKLWARSKQCCFFASSFVSPFICLFVSPFICLFVSSPSPLFLAFYLSLSHCVFFSYFLYFSTSLLFLPFPLYIHFFLAYVCLHLVLSFPQLESCFPGTLPRAEPTVCCNYKCANMKLFSEAHKTKFVAYTGQFGQAIVSIKSH
jgi:hypothetical protein